MSEPRAAGAPEHPAAVVDPAWVEARRERVVVCDVRSTMITADPRRAYLAAHLPGARFVDLDADLADPPAGTAGRHPLPSPERFAALLGGLGIALGAPVVAYDDAHGGFAARLVWMLRVTGQPAGLLDGGLGAWTGQLESGPVTVDPVDRPPVPWPAEVIVGADDVAGHLAGGGVVIDSRDAARYRGELEPIDAVAGHVPGALNLPFGENLRGGRFLPPADLATRFAPARDDPAPIVYCGSGVTACHNALAMERAGLPRPRVYVGSWSGWSSDRSRPVATGGSD